ncbi:hypothetical protein F5B22DRAFT_595452 [Xylaria bambusicola]|uniref:uncharacterized protein n=1 Tax=Xylaria bambusicola TaxID=326684 RepID=UPI0020084CFB|nr:uncharacterized protein F5B22DRAFT_595452 [Xylaria bambusicola]KAI0521570.1 hypothetical protein F5B22DRAFT_595452 [Xylaria bambusicola]
MAPTKWVTARKSFGSKSIALRPQLSHELPVAARWKPKGPFRLFDLPPELRVQVLSLALQDCEEQIHVIKIFLACRRLYTEAADIFYHETWVDISRRPEPPGLLAEPITALSPRRHVRTMNLTISHKTNLRTFHSAYVPVLREMADKGGLHTLRLEISGRFSRIDFWTDAWSDDDDFCDNEIPLLIGPGKDIEYQGPAFLAARPFQTFLDFLSDPHISKVMLYTASADHYEFWCECHRKLSSKLVPCNNGSWRGKASRLKVNQRRLLWLFRGAQTVRPLAAATSIRRPGASSRS